MSNTLPRVIKVNTLSEGMCLQVKHPEKGRTPCITVAEMQHLQLLKKKEQTNTKSGMFHLKKKKIPSIEGLRSQRKCKFLFLGGRDLSWDIYHLPTDICTPGFAL